MTTTRDPLETTADDRGQAPEEAHEGHSRLRLRAPGASVRFEDRGFRIVRGSGFQRGEIIPYSDITQLAVMRGGLAIGTGSGVNFLRRGQFAEPEDVERLKRMLLDRVAQLPEGTLQLARMLLVDERSQRRPGRRVIWTTAALCLVGTWLQFQWPLASQAASFVPGLVAQGEIWRIVTVHFLHDALLFPLHLTLNVLCLLTLGGFVERPLGAARTTLVLGASGLGAMLGCAIAGYHDVVGASGLVAGLAGAIVVLEFRHPDFLPATWRLPRLGLLMALCAQALLDVSLPMIAAAAHFGGFLGGAAATLVLAPRRLGPSHARPPTRFAVALLLVVIALAVFAAIPLARGQLRALEAHGKRLLVLSDLTPDRANSVAWLLVTDAHQVATRRQQALALALAEEAVELTERSNPDVLDTLAEVLFQSGDYAGALLTIDEAISLSPLDDYYREQRRRFTGERAADDRPEPPVLPWIIRERLQQLEGEGPDEDPMLVPGEEALTV